MTIRITHSLVHTLIFLITNMIYLFIFKPCILVTANDGVHQSSTEVIISVGDINDNAPNFNSSTLCMKIVENSPKNTLIGRAVADDADLESRIRYSIVNGR